MTTDTELLFTGTTLFDLLGNKYPNKANAAPHEYPMPHRVVLPLKSDDSVANVATGHSSCHIAIISKGGAVFTIGKNARAQLGIGKVTDAQSEGVETLKFPAGVHITSAACGRAHTFFLSEDGRLFAVGDNTRGQLGIGSASVDPVTTITEVPKTWDGVAVEISTGNEFAMLRTNEGLVYSFGCPQYGQLGNGSNGEFIGKGNRIDYDNVLEPTLVPGLTDVTSVVCGENHTVALDSNGKVWCWGFGGYGRLGFSSTADEHRPRRLESFDRSAANVKSISCGAKASFAVMDCKMTFMWGIMKSGGEANMYPKSIDDLQGWDVEHIVGGKSSTACFAENTLITWGCSPTFGELGYGKMLKTSSIPKKVDSVSDIQLSKLVMSPGFMLVICNSTPAIKKLPEINWENPSTLKTKSKRKAGAPPKKKAKK